MTGEDRVLGLLGLAARAKKLITGYNTCLSAIESGKLKLLIIAEEVGENSCKKMISKCTSRGIEYRKFGSAPVLSHAVGKTDKGIFGIVDFGFAESIKKEIDLIQSERTVTAHDESI
ncbi:MAG: L7Ae/L30e/S12e/Gadd45 family ribosomal protein [Eubacterium sp.]